MEIEEKLNGYNNNSINKKKGIIIIPFRNEAEHAEKASKKIIESLQTIEFTIRPFLYFIDDESSDDTKEKVRNVCDEKGYKEKRDFDLIVHEKNWKLPKSELEGYRYALQENFDYIIKTDLDKDHEYSMDIPLLVGGLCSDEEMKEMIVPQRHLVEEELREKKRKEDSVNIFCVGKYEFLMRESFRRIVAAKVDVDELDPASVGTQGFQKKTLKNLLGIPYIDKYDKEWGLDLVMILVAKIMLKIKPVIAQIPGHYDPEKRPKSKIDNQYKNYFEILEEILFLGKNCPRNN